MMHFLLQVPNNYETDLIFPIIEKASELANVSYARADDSVKTNLKVRDSENLINLQHHSLSDTLWSLC